MIDTWFLHMLLIGLGMIIGVSFTLVIIDGDCKCDNCIWNDCHDS